MHCQWQAFLDLLPIWLRKDVDQYGRNDLQELRLRIQGVPELVTGKGTVRLSQEVRREDLEYCINIASRYSPWAAETIVNGYITAMGGHRIGICGSAAVSSGNLKGLQSVSSLCIRVARDFKGIAAGIESSGSILIIGKPGSGKTTLLRDLIRTISDRGKGSVAVVDEREEIFPQVHHKYCFTTGKRTDVLSGCSKVRGIEMVLRSMGPDTIAVDEITASEDCEALLHAGWCGVKLLATAHAGSKEDLCSREVYKPIINSRLFDTIVVLQADKSWRMERMYI